MSLYLKDRLEKSKNDKFANCQNNKFIKLLNKKYNSVLEVGCGKGYFSYLGALNEKFKQCYGCDVYDDYKTDEIRIFSDKAEYSEIENNILPYEDNRFDLVFSMDVMEHVEDDLYFIKEKIRVCKKGGAIVIGTPNYWRLTNVFLKMIGKLKYPRKMGVDSYGEVIHLREYRKKDLERLLKKIEEAEKIENIRITGCWYGIMPLNIGFCKLPKLFDNFCQFWFIELIKE